MEDGSAVHTMSGNAETRDLKRTDWNRMAQAPFVGLKARARSTGSESGHGCGAVVSRTTGIRGAMTAPWSSGLYGQFAKAQRMPIGPLIGFTI